MSVMHCTRCSRQVDTDTHLEDMEGELCIWCFEDTEEQAAVARQPKEQEQQHHAAMQAAEDESWH